MAITTAAQARAGLLPPVYFSKVATGTMIAGRPVNLNMLAGYPSAFSTPTTSDLTSLTGQIHFPSSGGGNTYLAKLSALSSATPGMLLLCDRIWHTAPVSMATANSRLLNFDPRKTWIARDANGQTNGRGILIAYEVWSTLGTTPPTPGSVIYHDNGISSQGSPAGGEPIFAMSGSSPVGTFYPTGLGAGYTPADPPSGVGAYGALGNGTASGGTISVVAYRVLATLEIRMAGQRATAEFPSLGMPRCYDGTVPFLVFIPAGTTTTQISGSVTWAKG